MIECGRSEGFYGADRRGLVSQDCRSHAQLALALKCALPRQHFVKHCPQRKNVAAAVQLLAFDLLRRHVLKGAENSALLRHRRRLLGRCCEGGAGRERNCRLCQAEVRSEEHTSELQSLAY